MLVAKLQFSAIAITSEVRTKTTKILLLSHELSILYVAVHLNQLVRICGIVDTQYSVVYEHTETFKSYKLGLESLYIWSNNRSTLLSVHQ